MIRSRLHARTKLILLVICLSFILLCGQYMIAQRCSSSEELLRDKPKYRLVIVVLTDPDNMERRDIIRKTWLSERHKNVKYLFAIGTLDVRPEQRETLKSEKEKHKDLLLLPSLQDSYNTLTKKVLHSFAQVYEDYVFEFLLKCDDDSLVLVDRILKELEKRENKGTRKELYWGFFNGKAQVKRSGPWRESDWILCDYYLPYALGGGYVLSYNLVKFIATNSAILKIYKFLGTGQQDVNYTGEIYTLLHCYRKHNSEDVSVGLWLAPLSNIERKHEVRFDTEYRSRGCSNEYMITHKQSIENMNTIYQLYKATGALCVKEVRNRMSYQYDWSVPPSQCCNRQSGIP